MKLIIVSVLLVAVAADRLDNVYLPPSSANSAGGNANLLNTPSLEYGVPSNSYGVPSGSYNSPSTNYGVPSGRNSNTAFSNYVQSPEARAAILRFNNENNGDGSYRFEYETENKIYQQEAGALKNVGTQQEGSVVEGTYSYVGPDGKTYTVNYIADENGFRASGDHIPTPPPIPEAIQKSLVLIDAQKRSGKNGYPSGPYTPSFNQQSGYQY